MEDTANEELTVDGSETSESTPDSDISDREADKENVIDAIADGEGEAPIADGEGEAPVTDGEGETLVADGEEEAPVADGEGEAPVADGEGEAPIADGEGEIPVTDSEGEAPVADGGETPVADGEGETPEEAINEEVATEESVTSEEITISDNDDSEVTLRENAAGDPGLVTEDNVASDVSTETQSESLVETDTTDTNTNIDSDETVSQPAKEDSQEQNIETTDEVDSQPTPTASETTEGESDTPVTEELTADDADVEVVEKNADVETTTAEDSSEVGNTERTPGDRLETTEETAKTTTAEDSSEVDNAEENGIAASEETESEVEVSEETIEKTATTKKKVEEEAAQTEEETDEAVAEEKDEETDEAVAEEKDEETDEEVSEKDDDSQDLGQEVDRIAYDSLVDSLPTNEAISTIEEFHSTQLMGTYGLQFYGKVPSAKDISNRLTELSRQTGKKPAFINISLQSNQLQAFAVLPHEDKSAQSNNSLLASTDLNKIDSSAVPRALTLRETVKNTSRKDVIATATQFREEVSDSSKLDQSSYMQSAQELYKVLIEPIEAELEANNIDILVFSMDSGLRLLPLAALHDGEQFLIEKYAVATVPSFGLTDTRYVSLNKSSILAMGASEFAEQASLPTMPIELETIVSEPRQGEVFINEQFTLSNFKAQNSRETPFPIVHLGTHAEFKAGNLGDSYIQFYDDKLKIPQLQDLSDELGWNSDATPIELLVLSACETALGDEEAELGFAGLAVQAGVKSALASLWYVSDVGTLALMGEFYNRLDDTLIKAEALRQTQLKMLQGDVMVNDKQVALSSGQNLSLPPEFPPGTLTLDHPYFWSAFTLIGNWN